MIGGDFEMLDKAYVTVILRMDRREKACQLGIEGWIVNI